MSFEALPGDVLELLFEALDFKSFQRLVSSCKTFYRLFWETNRLSAKPSFFEKYSKLLGFKHKKGESPEERFVVVCHVDGGKNGVAR
jgi:hypothetical protein